MERYQENDYLAGWGLARLIGVQMALRAAIELNVFNIIANSGRDAQLSCAEIVSKIPTTNPNAATALDRILRMLSVNSLLATSHKSCLEGGIRQQERTYGLTRESRCLVASAGQLSSTQMLLFLSEREIVDSLLMLKHMVLEPAFQPFSKAYGENLFEYMSKEPRLAKRFNAAMASSAQIFFDMVFKVYKGFEEVKEIVDVAGGIGTSLGKLVSVYPHIRGINFDLPHVIADAPDYPGVEHISGDMFESIPNGETILMKWILHDWNDDQCVKLLRNCWKVLPENGKMIVVEFVIPQVLGTDSDSVNSVAADFYSMVLNPGGFERTEMEFENLAKAAGFAEIQLFPIAHAIHVLEFLKT